MDLLLCFDSHVCILDGKEDGWERKFLIRRAATFVVGLVIRERIKKRRPCITYGPMLERDQLRVNYMNNKIFESDIRCRNMLRLERAPFFRLCEILRDRSLLNDTIHVSVEEHVFNIIGHNLRNRVIIANFDRSNETVHHYFRVVHHAIGELRTEYIRPPSLEVPTEIEGSPRMLNDSL